MDNRVSKIDPMGQSDPMGISAGLSSSGNNIDHSIDTL